MTRDISALTESASQAAVIAPLLFAKLEFEGGDVLVHSGLGEVTFGGDTYLGVGNLGGISPVEEDAELTRSNLRLTLTGIPSQYLAVFLGEQYQGRPATILLGYRDPGTMQLVDTPVVIYRGRMDSAEIDRGREAAIALSVESRFAAWDRPQARRYNNSDQQSRYPGDRGLEFVEQATDKQINWGKAG